MPCARIFRSACYCTAVAPSFSNRRSTSLLNRTLDSASIRLASACGAASPASRHVGKTIRLSGGGKKKKAAAVGGGGGSFQQGEVTSRRRSWEDSMRSAPSVHFSRF